MWKVNRKPEDKLMFSPQTLNTPLNNFVHKYLTEYKNKRKLSKKEDSTFQKDLAAALSSRIVKQSTSKGRTPSAYELPKDILHGFSKDEKKKWLLF